MIISELIEKLEKLKKEYGDLPVWCHGREYACAREGEVNFVEADLDGVFIDYEDDNK